MKCTGRVRVKIMNCKSCRCSSISFYSIITHWPFDKSKKPQIYDEEPAFYDESCSTKSQRNYLHKVWPRCDHYSNHPVISQNAWKYLWERDFKWPNPIPSTDHPNHYMTYIKISRLDKEFFLIGKSILLACLIFFFNLKP